MQKKPVIVSGVQSSGNIHIGNYLGAIQNWIGRQDTHDCYIFVADMHALTVPGSVSPEDLRASRRRAVAAYVASGIDPDRSVIFCQADVEAHAYAGWLMTCATPIGWLERMTQFKSKARSGEKEAAGAGLLTYPALQAADIVLYNADLVPTGHDQKQHIEYARDLVERFNHLYPAGLTVPSPMIERTGARVMGLDDPTSKMSKSTAKQKGGHAVFLDDDDALIRKKFRRAVTDSGTGVDAETSGPGVRNLVEIIAACGGQTLEQAFKDLHGVSYGELKNAAADAVIKRVAPIRERIVEINQNPDEVEGILEDGAARARKVATATLSRMRAATGLA